MLQEQGQGSVVPLGIFIHKQGMRCKESLLIRKEREVGDTTCGEVCEIRAA